MSIKFHPQHETLLNYTGGNLSPAYMSVIEVHTKFCSGCANLVSQLEKLGGMAIDSQPATIVETSFDQLMQLVSEQETRKESLTPHHEQSPLKHIMQYAKYPAQKAMQDKSRWINVVRGIKDQKINIDDEKYRSRLMFIKAGTKIPAHTHTGEEVTVVLKGSFSDDFGQYQAGDFIVRDGSHEHSPYADTDCICYAITDAPLHYTGLFGPVIKWFNQRFEEKHYGSVN